MIQEAAALLLNARRSAAPLTELPQSCRPLTPEDAYAIQDVVVRELGGIGGWKVGAATPEAVPSCSPLPAPLIFRSGHVFPPRAIRLNGVEAELAFTFAQALPPRSEPYGADDVAQAIRSVHAAIEVVDSRYEDMRAVDPLSQLADLGNNGALVVGGPRREGVRVDQTWQAVELFVGGASVFQAVGGNTAGDVFRLLAWLANHAAARSGGLRAGQVVTTGSCSGVRFLASGDRVRANFPGVGECEVSL
jgi:2-keto-4-pentenoate hydratase